MQETTHDLITDEKINESLIKLNDLLQQSKAINSSTFSSALSSLAQVAIENQKVQADVLSKAFALACQEWIKSSTDTFEILYDLANSIDIQPNTSILQALDSDVVDTETLVEIAQLSRSNNLLELISEIENQVKNPNITAKQFNLYLEIIIKIITLFGFLLSSHASPTLHIEGDVNISININTPVTNEVRKSETDSFQLFINEDTIQE